MKEQFTAPVPEKLGQVQAKLLTLDEEFNRDKVFEFEDISVFCILCGQQIKTHPTRFEDSMKIHIAGPTHAQHVALLNEGFKYLCDIESPSNGRLWAKDTLGCLVKDNIKRNKLVKKHHGAVYIKSPFGSIAAEDITAYILDSEELDEGGVSRLNHRKAFKRVVDIYEGNITEMALKGILGIRKLRNS